MKHRSPDEIRSDDTIGMGRLAILDLKSSDLCLYKNYGLVLAYNGEIYNYKDIRRELLLHGYKFTTQSDTEVLLASYHFWGEKCLEKFNGMFAFAIKDGDTYFLARDIAGEKPLYYTKDPFAFASENKALNFKGTDFPPAHFGIYDGKTLEIKPYWQLKKREINLKTAEEELEWLLEDSVRLRTQVDVPYGIFYSGGVDSSLIQSFHNFDHKYTYDEKDYGKDFKQLFPKILWHLDGTINSFSAYALWKLSEQASNDGVKVILSGEGADELFGGYVRYVPNSLTNEARKHFPSYKSVFPVKPDVNEMGWNEFNGNMRELLRMGDRMTSAFGIENRCPFLDKRIIEFAFSLPPEAKIQGFETKIMLRRVLQKLDPSYIFREKHGLYVPVNKWLGSDDKYEKTTYIKYQQELWKSLQQ